MMSFFQSILPANTPITAKKALAKPLGTVVTVLIELHPLNHFKSLAFIYLEIMKMSKIYLTLIFSLGHYARFIGSTIHSNNVT